MKRRCYNPASKSYQDYGARGIVISATWLHDFPAFQNWAFANGWKPGLQIDRINNDGPYSPENCRCTDSKTQHRNTRANRILEAFGEKKCLIEWSEDSRCVVSWMALTSRLRYGWPVEEALTMPLQQGRRLRKT
jgi:hypothetical protein